MSGQEKNFENKIKSYLKKRGHYYVKFFANGFTKKGIPDILACVNGRWVSIEVKASRGRPSELQIYNRDEIRKAGGVSIILYPDKFDVFTRLIEDIEDDKYDSQIQYVFD